MITTRRTVLAATAATAIARPAGAATRVGYWHHFTPPEAKGAGEVAARFGTRNPELTVASEAIPQPDYLTKVTAASVSGSLPDTGMVTGFRFGDFVGLGALTDLSARVAGWPGRSAFAEAAWGPATREGKVYGIPSTSFVSWMWYRPDYFAEAGVKVPDTLEEFLQVAIKLTDPGRNRYGFGMRGGAGGAQYLIETIMAYGSPIVRDNRPAMDRAKTLEAVRFYSELFTRYKVTPPSTPNDSYRQIMDGFKTGQTAMIWHHTGSVTEIIPALGREKAATAIRPRGPATRFAQVEYLYNGVMNPRAQDAGWKWISYWAEPEAALTFLDATGYFPASRTAAQDPRILNDKLYDAARDTLTFGAQLPSFSGFDNWSAQVVLPAFQTLLVGQSSVERTVDVILRGLDDALR